MANSALTRLQEQVEAVRREAYAAGYAAAMEAVRELAARPLPDTAAAAEPTAPAGGRGQRRAAPAERRPRSTGQRGRPRAARGPRTGRPQRGTNARLIEEVLQAIGPRGARPSEIRTALQRDKGAAVAFTSIRHALGQLEARGAVELLPDGKSWRHRAGEAAPG